MGENDYQALNFPSNFLFQLSLRAELWKTNEQPHVRPLKTNWNEFTKIYLNTIMHFAHSVLKMVKNRETVIFIFHRICDSTRKCK